MTMETKVRTLAERLALPAGAELDAAVANALGDDLGPRTEAEFIVACRDILYYQHISHKPHGATYEECLVWPERVGRPATPVWVGTDGVYRLVEGVNETYLQLWQTREGKPYATALEAAVAAYRRPAPPYSTDGNAMLDLLVEMKNAERPNWDKDWHLVTKMTPYVDNAHNAAFVPGWVLQNIDDYTIEYQRGETLPLAVCRAALAALEETNNAVDRQ